MTTVPYVKANQKGLLFAEVHKVPPKGVNFVRCTYDFGITEKGKLYSLHGRLVGGGHYSDIAWGFLPQVWKEWVALGIMTKEDLGSSMRLHTQQSKLKEDKGLAKAIVRNCHSIGLKLTVTQIKKLDKLIK